MWQSQVHTVTNVKIWTLVELYKPSMKEYFMSVHEESNVRKDGIPHFKQKMWKIIIHISLDNYIIIVYFSSVQFNRSVMSDSLRPHGLQHARLPCPSPTPTACSNSCPSSWWCHTTISSSVFPLSSCLQSFPASGSFPRSLLFASDDQSIRVSASASVLPMNIQDSFPSGKEIVHPEASNFSIFIIISDYLKI